MAAAVIQGLGGSSLAINAAQLAFIADSSPTTTRSFYLALVVVSTTIGSSVAPLAGISFVSNGEHGISFVLANTSWLVYLLYLTFVLRETRFPDPLFATLRDIALPADVSGSPVDPIDRAPLAIADISWTPRSVLSSVIEPVKIVSSDWTLRWLGIIAFVMPLTERLFGISATRHMVAAIKSDSDPAFVSI